MDWSVEFAGKDQLFLEMAVAEMKVASEVDGDLNDAFGALTTRYFSGFHLYIYHFHVRSAHCIAVDSPLPVCVSSCFFSPFVPFSFRLLVAST